MSWGVVPIVSNVQGHDDLISVGYNGFLFAGQKQLVNILFKTQSCLSEKKYKEMSASAKDTVKKLSLCSINIIKNHFLKYGQKK